MRALTVLMAPFLPHSADRCAEMLRIDGDCLPWADATSELGAGHGLGEPMILFRKLDAAELFPESESTEG